MSVKGPTSLFPRGQRDDDERDHNERATDGGIDYAKAAPRWFLLLVVAVLIFVSGWALNEVRGGYGRDLARLEQAQADAPSKYQARLSERVAVVEAQAAALNGGIQSLSTQIERQNQATTALTIELRSLTAEMRARR